MTFAQRHRRRHRLNVQGPFYVEDGVCMACAAPHFEAPELMDFDAENHCYFKKQPSTQEELDHAIEAVWVSCCQGLRYAGDDPTILRRLTAKDCADCCDVPLTKK